MSQALLNLKLQAISLCKGRGHVLSAFAPGSRDHVAICHRCDMTVTVNERPLPNEIDIGGEAVALHCRPKV